MKLKQNISFLFAALIVACGAASQVPKTAADGTKCAQDIIAAVGGSINIAQSLIDCGLTIDDFIGIVQTWIQNNQGDAAATQSPEMIRAHQILDAAKAYKAAHQ